MALGPNRKQLLCPVRQSESIFKLFCSPIGTHCLSALLQSARVDVALFPGMEEGEETALLQSRVQEKQRSLHVRVSVGWFQTFTDYPSKNLSSITSSRL